MCQIWHIGQVKVKKHSEYISKTAFSRRFSFKEKSPTITVTTVVFSQSHSVR